MADVSCQNELMFGFVSRRGVIFVIVGGLGTSGVVGLIRFVVFRFMARTWPLRASFSRAGRTRRIDPQVVSWTRVEKSTQKRPWTWYRNQTPPRSAVKVWEEKRDLILDPFLSEHGNNWSHAHHRQPI